MSFDNKLKLGDTYQELPKSKFQVQHADNIGNYPFYTSGDKILIHSEYNIDDEVIFLATGGKANVKYNSGKSSYSTDTYAIKGKDHSVKYLYYLLLDRLSYIDRTFFSGSGLKHLQKKDFRNWLIGFPDDISEEEKISRFLSILDKVMAATEMLIAKYQRIKTGLLQDLLTRGIDNRGNLRNEKTHKFKDSQLGMIPVEWDIVKTGSLCKEIVVGIVIRPTQYYVETGIPMLRSFNVREDKIEMKDLVYMTKENNEILAKSKLKADDVVSVRTGYPGTSAVITKDIEGCNCIDLVISRVNKSVLNPYFLATWQNSFFAKKQILNHQSGNAQQHFNVGQMKELLIIKVSIDEQNEIMKIVKSEQSKILKTLQNLSKLQSLKTGLMRDLLSGRIRL